MLYTESCHSSAGAVLGDTLCLPADSEHQGICLKDTLGRNGTYSLSWSWDNRDTGTLKTHQSAHFKCEQIVVCQFFSQQNFYKSSKDFLEELNKKSKPLPFCLETPYRWPRPLCLPHLRPKSCFSLLGSTPIPTQLLCSFCSFFPDHFSPRSISAINFQRGFFFWLLTLNWKVRMHTRTHP